MPKTGGGLHPIPIQGDPAAQLAGTVASRDAAAAAQVVVSLQRRRKAPGDRQDQAPGAEWCCPTMTVQLSLLHCPNWPWSSQEPQLCLVQQCEKQQQCVIPHPLPHPWSTTAGKKTKRVFFSSAVSSIFSSHHS